MEIPKQTVLIVDDSAFMRTTIRKALLETEKYDIVGEAEDSD